MKKFFLLLISFATYFNIHAQEWNLIGDNDEYELYIRNHSETSAWVKWEYKKVKISENILGKKERLKQLLVLFKFDCDNKMSGTMAEVSYDDEGNILSSDDTGDYANMKNVIPDTTGEWILFNFCNLKD